jgi:hypothetical protein
MQTEIVVAFIGMFGAILVAVISAISTFRNRKNTIDGEFKKETHSKLDAILQQSPVVIHRMDAMEKRLAKEESAICELEASIARVDESAKTAYRRNGKEKLR